MEENNLVSSQDFILQYVHISTSKNVMINIKNLVIEFNYFEDIFSNSVSGNIVVNDSNDLISGLALTGNEFIEFVLEKPALGCAISKKLKLFSVSNRVMTNDTNENYILHFCAEEILLSEQYRVSKSYKNKKVSEIVKHICNEYLNISTSKQIAYNVLRIEDTKKSLNLIVPNLKPFEAINWLSVYAQPVGSPSTFLFFQNYDGYNFKSLQSMYQLPAIDSYQYEPKNIASATDGRVTDIVKDLKNIISYEILDQFNLMNAISNGAFANRLISIDLLNQSYNNTLFDYSTYFPFSKHLNKNSLLTNAKNSSGDTVNKTPDGALRVTTSLMKQSINPYVLSKGQSIRDIEIEKFLPTRMSELALINMIRVKMVVPGNPLLTVGKNINFNLSTIGLKDEGIKKLDKFYSGKYLITAVRHKADNSGVFQTVLEICKESTPNALDTYVDTTTLASLGY